MKCIGFSDTGMSKKAWVFPYIVGEGEGCRDADGMLKGVHILNIL
jgi:hypothetical protein